MHSVEDEQRRHPAVGRHPMTEIVALERACDIEALLNIEPFRPEWAGGPDRPVLHGAGIAAEVKSVDSVKCGGEQQT
jgi:hypothetical protein